MPYPDETLGTQEPSNAYDRLVSGLSPAAPEPAPAPVQPPAAEPTKLVDEMKVTKAPLGMPVGKVAPTPEKPKEAFGQGKNLYDMESAVAAGLKADATGHWASRVPSGEKEGLLLKHETHPTFNLTLKGEAEMGNRIFRSPDGRLYSFGPDKVVPKGFTDYSTVPKAQDTDYDRFVKGGLPTTPQMSGAEFDPNTLPPEARKLYDERKVGADDSMLWRGLKHGMAGLGETAGTLTRAAGHAMEIPELKKLGAAGEEYFGEMARNWEPPKEIAGAIWDNPGLLKNSSWWAYSVADMVPSLAGAIAAAWGGGMTAAGVGARMALSPAAIRRLAMLGASVTGGAAGGSMEGASTYREVLERTGNEDTALRAGTMMAFASAGLNAISLHKMLAPGMREALRSFVAKGDVAGLKQLAKHMAATGATEATTEYLEEPAEALIKQFMAPGKYTEDEFWDQLKQGLNVMPPSFLMGGLGGIGGAKASTAIERKAGTLPAVELVEPAPQPAQQAQQTLPGMEPTTQQPTTPPPAAPPVGVPSPTTVQTPTETPLGAPTPTPTETPAPTPGQTPVEAPAAPGTPLDNYLTGVQNIEDMSFDDLVKLVQERHTQEQQQAAASVAPAQAEQVQQQQVLADTSTLGKDVATGAKQQETVTQASVPLGSPASLMTEVASPMVTAPGVNTERTSESPMFGEAERTPEMERFLRDNDLSWEELGGWSTDQLQDLQFEFEGWQKAEVQTRPELPSGPTWDAYVADHGQDQAAFEGTWWNKMPVEMQRSLLDDYVQWAQDRGMDPGLASAEAVQAQAAAQAEEAAPTLPPEMLEQLRVMHRQAIEKAVTEGRMSREKAEQLGHLNAHEGVGAIFQDRKATPERAMTLEDWTQTNLPAMEQSIRNMSMALTNTEAFVGSGFYDGSFPIPRQGGIIMAIHSHRYAIDPVFRDKVDDAIHNIGQAILAANRTRMLMLDTMQGAPEVHRNVAAPDMPEMTGKKGTRATYGADIQRMWNVSARNKYSESKLGNIGVREGLQNSLDAVLEAIENGEIKKGEIKIVPFKHPDRQLSLYEHEFTGFVIEDNGIGMGEEDIGSKFLALYGTGKDKEGRFGGFGLAKAVILMPAESATWTLWTRDNFFNAEMAANVDNVGQTEKRQGTMIKVESDEVIIDDRAKMYVSTTVLPKNITVTYGGEALENPFKGVRGKNLGEVRIDDNNSYELTYYHKPTDEFKGNIVYRLVDEKTGAKLTQGIEWEGGDFKGCLVVDIKTKGTPGSWDYPLNDSRESLKYGHWREPINSFIQKATQDKRTVSRDQGKPTWHSALGLPGWKNLWAKLQNDTGWNAMRQMAAEWGHTPTVDFQPGTWTQAKKAQGFKGKWGASPFTAKYALAMDLAASLTSEVIGANYQSSYLLFENPLDDGGVILAEYDGTQMGINPTTIDEAAMQSPLQLAMYIRGLVNHELTHTWVGRHNEDYSSHREHVGRKSWAVFPKILALTEAAMQMEETAFGQRAIPTAPGAPAPQPTTVQKTQDFMRANLPKDQLELFEQERTQGYGDERLFYPLGPNGERQLELFPGRVERGAGEQHRVGGNEGAGAAAEQQVRGEPAKGGEGSVEHGRNAPGILGVPAANVSLPGESAGTGGAAAGAAAPGPVRAQQQKRPLANVFYSQMEKHLEAKLPGKGTGKELASLVEGWAKKGGFKEAELKWTGLLPWLREQEGTVTKKQIMDFVAENNVNFEEITRTPEGMDIDDIDLREVNREYVEQEAETEYVVVDQDTGEELGYFFDEGEADDFLAAAEKEAEEREEEPNIAIEERYREPEYDEYSEVEVDLETDGGDLYSIRGSAASGYWEIIDTPRGVDIPRQGFHSWEAVEDAVRELETKRALEVGLQSKYDQYALRGGDEYKEFQMVLKPRPRDLAAVRPGMPLPAKYTTSHWDEADVVVHMRATTRIDKNGKRTFFVEEVQSDWGQDWRQDQKTRKDIQDERTKLMNRAEEIAKHYGLTVPQAFREANRTDHGAKVGGAYMTELRNIMARTHELMAEQAKIGNEPRMKEPPMAKTWHELAMKRLIRYAAENGYDAIAWTTGQQQIDRYNLSEHVDRVNYAPHLDGGRLTAMKNDEMVVQETNVTPEKLERYLGKEGAKKLLSNESGESIEGKPIYRLEGEDLKLGGEGMRVFYDEILANYMKKYGKQWGATVADTVISTEGPNAHLTEFRAVPNRNVTYPHQTEKGWAIHDARTNTDWGFFPTVREAIDKFEEAHQGQTVANPLYMVEAWDNRLSQWVPMMGAQSGVRLEEAQEYAANQYERMKLDTATVHGMTLTPEMKEAVLYNGQALWRLGEGLDVPGSVTTEVLQARLGAAGTVTDMGSTAKYRRSWGIEFNNGKMLVIAESWQGQLDVQAFVESDAQWAELGLDLDDAIVTGAFSPMAVGGLIEFAKGQGLRTVDHELWHFIKHWLLTEKERAMLDKTYGGNEEAEAEAYADWKPSTPNTIFQKIMDFARSIVTLISGYRTPEALFAAARSGELFKREAMENLRHGTKAQMTPTSDRETINAYGEQKVAPAEKPTTWRDTLKDFKDYAAIKERVIPALWKFWEKAYTEIFAEHAPIERLAKFAKEKVIVGIPRKVGEILDWALAAHRGSVGFAQQALVGDKEGGVFLPKMESGYETTETQALQQEIEDLLAQTEGRVTSKVRRKMEKLSAKLAEAFTTGDIEKVHDSLAVVVEPLRELAARRGWDVDRVFNDLFHVKMVAERDLELSGELGERLKTIEKGVDPAAAKQVLEALEREYGTDYETMQNVATAVRSWADAAIIEPLIRSGRLSTSVAQQIRDSNKYYVPFFRLMEEMENKGFMGPGESVFEVRKIPIKEIKGSERKIVDPLSMFTALVYNVADAAGRAQVANTIAQVPLFSEAGGDIKVVKAKFFPVPVELKQEVDPVLRGGLQQIADALGIDVKVMQRVKSFRGALGVFVQEVNREVQEGEITPEERKWIELMFGTTERTKAHEVGHGIDAKYATIVDGKKVGGLVQALMASPQMKKELRAIADQRASDSASKSFRKYIRQREEQVADFVNRYVNANDQAQALAPNVVKAFEAFIGQHPELKPLLTLRPSGQAEVMTMEGKTWTRSPFRPVANALMVYRNGTPYWVQMPEDVFKACMGMTRGDVGILVKIAAKPASWLRAGAVLSPEFISRNPLRDVVMAWVFSRHGFSIGEWFGDAYKLFTGDAQAKALMAQFQGSGAAFADIATMFVETQAITADKIMGKEKGIKYLAHPIEALREISSFMENTTRYSVYRQAMANGASHAAALHEARTVTLDFHRFGANPYVRTLNMIIPFFNASLQGVDKLGSELLGGDKKRAMQVLRKIMIGITLPSVLLWAMNHDDDRIKKLEAWERNLFWHIPIPGGPILRFPKPFEVGIMFGSILERTLDYAVTKDPSGLKQALAQAFDALTPSPYPTIVRPFMEQTANWNFFMNRKIEDASMENLPVELRAKPWTSEAAKFFSRNFGKYLGISPVMFEQHVRNIFGGLGSNYALPMIDYTMRKAGVVPDIAKADEKWYLQTPFIRGLFSRDPSGFRSKTANDFFENYTKSFTSDQGWKTLWKHGQAEDAAEMVKDNPQAIFARMVRKEMSELGKIRKERDTIIRDSKLDGAAKRAKLEAIDKRVDAILSVNQAMMHPMVMEQVTAPVTTAIKKTGKTEKDVEKYYNMANQPITKAFEKITKDWKKYEAMDVTERSNAIAKLIKEQQRSYVPPSGGGSSQKKDSFTVLGLPSPNKKGLDIFGEKEKSGRKGYELFPSSK